MASNNLKKIVLIIAILLISIFGFSQNLELPLNLNLKIGTIKSNAIQSNVKSFVLRQGNSSLREVALTIDDGYNLDERILNLLESYNIRLTIFIVGEIVDRRPDLILKMDQLGWEIGNHTYSHVWSTDTLNVDLQKEVEKTENSIRRVLSKDSVKYFRPPFGDSNQRVLETISLSDYKIIFWSNNLQDTTKGSKIEDQVKYVFDHLQNGSIILCHFGGYNTYEVLKISIPEILAQGYTFVTISEMIQHL